MREIEDDDIKVMCLEVRVTGLALAWDLVQMFLSAHFKGNERFTRCLAKVAAWERKEKV
jgi:ribose 5-phosphate isomerase B